MEQALKAVQSGKPLAVVYKAVDIIAFAVRFSKLKIRAARRFEPVDIDSELVYYNIVGC